MIMKQNYSIIKLFMLTIMAFFAGNAMAEDIIWQEDFSSFQKDQLPTGGTYQYACEGAVLNEDGSVKSGTKVYAEALAGGTAPELLVAKNGGSFSATIALNGKSGDMNLQFKTNRDNMTVEVTGATLGEKQRSGNTDTYALTGASGTLTIKIKAGNSNARLDDIKLYQGTALKPAGLSWGKASTSVTLGDEASYANLPTLSNENGLSVTCTSSNEAVATVTSDGVISVVGVGTTTITASFAGNSEYEAQTVSFELTVKEGGSVTPPTPSELTVAQALEIINGLEDGKTTSETYTVKGFVVGTPDFQRKNDGTLYGNCNFDIADAKGGTPTLTIYRGKSFDNNSFTEEDVAAPILKEGDEVVLTGKLQKYVKNEVMTPELTNGYLVSVNGKTGDDTPPTPATEVAVENIAAAKAQADGTNVILTLKDALVLYTWTSNNNNTQTFVRDASGAIQFYNTELPLNAGDVLNGEVHLTYSPYNGLPELKKNENTDAGDYNVTPGAKVEPVEITEETAADNLNDMVTIKNFTPFIDVTTKEDGTTSTRYYTSESKAVQLYNGFHLDGLDDALAALDASKQYNVEGIMVKGEINVIEIEEVQPDVPGGEGKAISYNEEPTVTNVTLEGMTSTGSETNCATWADGYSIMIMRSDKAISAGGNITVEGETYKTIKVSNGAQNTITAPNGKAIKSMTFFSYINIKSSATRVRSSFWKEVDGVTYDGSDGFMKSSSTLVFDAGAIEGSEGLVSTETPDKRSFELAEPKNKVTFTNSGEQLCYVLFVEEVEGTGINDVNAENIVINTPAYNLAGQKVGNNYKGIVIKNGRKYIK